MNGSPWLPRVTSVLGALLAIAVVARVAWELLRPVVPMLVVLAVVIGIVKLLVGSRRRYW